MARCERSAWLGLGRRAEDGWVGDDVVVGWGRYNWWVVLVVLVVKIPLVEAISGGGSSAGVDGWLC